MVRWAGREENRIASGQWHAGNCDGRPKLQWYNFKMKTLSHTAVLDRFLDPVGRCLNEDCAMKLIGLRADAKAQARVDELAEKCNEGELTPSEREEYETYVMAAEFVAVLQSKARQLLARTNRAQ
jgi:hypothetical protein